MNNFLSERKALHAFYHMKILAFNCYVGDFRWERVCGGKETKISQL